MITEQEIRDRLNNARCPYCGGDNYSEGRTEQSSEETRQNWYCLDCNVSWVEVFVIDRVELLQDSEHTSLPEIVYMKED